MNMRAVILAGGYGTRISEESTARPKPMVEIGGRPILWHIMKGLSHWGINDFVVCLGYKGHMIKSFFADYFLHTSDVTFDLAENRLEVHEKHAEPWRVTLVDTGEATNTGGRIKRVANFVADDGEFLMTYGDGVADVDIAALRAHHAQQGRLATLTSVQPPARWGCLDFDGQTIQGFREKAPEEAGWINGGFMILKTEVLDYISGDTTSFESEVLSRLAADGQLAGYAHRGFWQAMDTLRDRNHLEALWQQGRAPWAMWMDREVTGKAPVPFPVDAATLLARQAG